MIIYVDGCSHTDGHCFNLQNTVENYTWPHMVCKKLFYNEYYTIKLFSEENFLNSNIEEIIKNKKNILLDASYSGKSNPSIVYNTVNYLSKLIKNNIKIDYSFIQITGSSRNIVFDIDGMKDVTPNDNVKFGIRMDPFASIKTLQEIYFLQLFFKQHSIKDFYIPYFQIKDYENFMDLDLSKFTKNPFEGYIDNFKQSGYVCDEQGHPNKIGNEIISKDVLEKIDKKRFI